MDYIEKARKWLFEYGGSSGFSIVTCNQLAEWMEKADKFDAYISLSYHSEEKLRKKINDSLSETKTGENDE